MSYSFRGFTSAQLHCFEPKERQNVKAEIHGGRKLLSLLAARKLRERARKKKKKLGTRNTF